jgi:hypothetical protein
MVGCASPPSDEPAPAYLNDASFRRRQMVGALVNPANLYSQERLAHYATQDRNDWDLLPEWNPPAEVVEARELETPGGATSTPLSSNALPLTLPPALTSAEDPALIALGKAAFERYPAQIAPYLAVALSSPGAASRYGLWIDPARGVGGLVRARMADGSGALAMTCSTCHTARSGSGPLCPGLPNRGLDIGRAMLVAAGEPPALWSHDPIAAWGPGRLDVTTTTGQEPVRIPDLRPVRWLSFLQQDATLRAGDLITLAMRIETQLVTAGLEAVRPPRIIALALSAYVFSLGEALPALEAVQREAPRGAAVFAGACTRCHVSPSLTGSPVALAAIGTDPAFGLSPSRGTGTYRVPSLRGVGTRGPLFHDGTLLTVEAVLDRNRLTDSFSNRAHGQGPVPGHLHGLDLPAADREDLIDFLRRL